MEFIHYGYFYQLSIYFSYLFYLHQGATQTPIKILFLSILHYIYQYFLDYQMKKSVILLIISSTIIANSYSASSCLSIGDGQSCYNSDTGETTTITPNSSGGYNTYNSNNGHRTINTPNGTGGYNSYNANSGEMNIINP